MKTERHRRRGPGSWVALAASLVVPIAASAGIPGTIAIAAHPSAPPGVGVFVQAGAGGETDFQSGIGSYVVAADHVLTKEHSRFATAAGVTRQTGNANVLFESAMSLRGNATLADVSVSGHSRLLVDAGVTANVGNLLARENAGLSLAAGATLTH